jgi:hypothetical protein
MLCDVANGIACALVEVKTALSRGDPVSELPNMLMADFIRRCAPPYRTLNACQHGLFCYL